MTEGRRAEPDEGAEVQPREGADAPSTDAEAPEDATASLETLRDRILEVDEALVRLVGERRQLVLDIGRRKAESGQPVMDPSREATVVRRAAALARDEGIDEEMVRDVIWRIIASARDEQEGRTRWGPPAELDPRPDGGADRKRGASGEGRGGREGG